MKKLEEEAKKFMQSKNKSMITADEYQEKAKATAIYPKKDALPYLSLGLVSEAGEVAGKIKKLIRDGTQSDVASEIGDVPGKKSPAHWSRIFRERLYNKSAPPSKKNPSNMFGSVGFKASRRIAKDEFISTLSPLRPE